MNESMKHPEFERLPHFRILEIQEKNPPEYPGVFDTDLRIGRGGFLLSENAALVCGRFYGFDALRKTAVFKPQASVDTNSLEAGKLYAFLDGYWGERVALVLDRTEQWNRKEFVSVDTVEYSDGKTRISGKVGQDAPHPSFKKTRIVKDGWDHEHCEICWEKIAQYAQPYGYESNTGKWICEKCYSDYVEPQRISFIDDLAVSQILGEQKP